jgi:hypothetical protein
MVGAQGQTPLEGLPGHTVTAPKEGRIRQVVPEGQVGRKGG